ncbi:MAG: RdgB/HAM1 family non-canonical purine NTP pyrophosphatase [Oscillospiraceae bacterium]|nr:RdgB/HAM1 family non-canonical purine NTP pyrophosphatase [Oscillospiraceae bacterium]
MKERFVIATHNKKKLGELSRILLLMDIDANTIEAHGFPTMEEPAETGRSFAENALIKAYAACKYTGLPAIADDSGLCVDALQGGPGIYTGRYGGPDLSDKERYELLLHTMRDISPDNRSARFVCAICVAFPNGKSLTVSGECKGFIGYKPQGEGGFGYDPVFYLPDGRCFAELSSAEKDAVSHRGNALRALNNKLPQFLIDIHK